MPNVTGHQDSLERHRWQRFGCPLVVAVVALAFGWPTLNGEFLSGDDQRLVTEHYLVNHPSLPHAIELFSTLHGDLYQPLPMVSFQIDYARSDATPTERAPVSARPFHVTNILLHAINAVLAYLLAFRISGCRRVGLLAGLMFACHPFAVEPVAWINGRMILLATLFSLVTLLLCIENRKPGFGILAGTTISWCAAVLSKVIPTVPLAALCIDFVKNGRLPMRKIILYCVLLMLGLAGTWLALQATQDAGFLEGMQAENVAPLPVRLLMATRYYIENYFWPSRLAAWSPPPVDLTITSPPVIVAMIEILLLASLAWIARRRVPVASIGIILFAVLLSPLLAAGAARKFLAADRYMYLPIVGLHLGLAATAVAALDYLIARLSRIHADLSVGAPLVLVLAGWMTYSWQLAPTWSDSVSRDRHVVDIYPDSELAHAELAKAMNIEGDPDGALRTVEVARRKWPESGPLAAVAGEAYRLKGDATSARKELELAARQMPGHILTLYRLGKVMEALGNDDEAFKLFDRILDASPRYAPALIAMASIDQSRGRTQSAIEHYRRALAVNPYSRDCRFNLALMLMETRRWSDAKDCLTSLVAEDGDDNPSRLNLAVCLVQTKAYAEALAQYDILKAKEPKSVSVIYNRAILLATMGRNADSENEFRHLLSIDPSNWNAMLDFSERLQRDRRYEDMLKEWQEFLQKANNPGEAWAWIAWSGVLAGKSEIAREADTKVSKQTDGHRLLDWARAFESLRDGHADVGMLKQLESTSGTPRNAQLANTGRTVLLAIATLPKTVRASNAGVLALAAAAADSGYDSMVVLLVDDVFSEVSDPTLLAKLKKIRALSTDRSAATSQEALTSQ